MLIRIILKSLNKKIPLKIATEKIIISTNVLIKSSYLIDDNECPYIPDNSFLDLSSILNV
jgi:hypothetical protein